MKHLGARDFRPTFHRLTESTVVTALGRPIGVWLTLPDAYRIGIDLGQAVSEPVAAAFARNLAKPVPHAAIRPVPKPGKPKPVRKANGTGEKRVQSHGYLAKEP